MKRRNLKTALIALVMGVAITSGSNNIYASEVEDDVDVIVDEEEVDVEDDEEMDVEDYVDVEEIDTDTEANIEETIVTETKAPETAVPETKEPESTASETQAETKTESKVYTVPEGVYVNGVDMSGLTLQQLEEKLQQYTKDVSAGVLTLTAGDKSATISYGQIDAKAGEHTVVESISEIGTKGNLVKRYKELADIKNNTVDYSISFEYNPDKLKSVVTTTIQPFNQEAKDAEFKHESGEVVLLDEVVGRKVNVEATIQAVEAALENWNGSNKNVEIVAEETQPAHTKAELEVIKDQLGGYSTYYGWGDARADNIYNGARLINNKILYPGEVFSFLQNVMPFTESNGYYESTGYSGGKIVPSMGGGICQVSSTLYNAVLRAELEIVERYNHGLTVGYVPLAADATVAEDSVDFKFKNNMETPIYIEAYTSDGELYINIYGKEVRPANRSIEFYSETEESFEAGDDVITKDSSLPEGYREVTQGAYTGYIASLYKSVYVDGELQETIHINRSEYSAAPRYVTVGTGTDSDSKSKSSDEDEHEDTDDKEEKDTHDTSDSDDSDEE